MSIEFTELPSEEQALEELRPLTDTLFELLPSVATEEVLPYFVRRGRPVNERLATDMLRYEAKWHLNRLGIDVEFEEDPVEDADDTELSLNWLPNNGIEGTFNGWAFKLLRSRDGEVPRPGKSARKKGYFGQQLSLFASDGRDQIQKRPNTVLLWDFDAEYSVVSLKLAIPREVIGRNGYVSCHYNIPVPRPITHRSEAQDFDAFPLFTSSRDHEFIEPEVTRKRSSEQDFELSRDQIKDSGIEESEIDSQSEA